MFLRTNNKWVRTYRDIMAKMFNKYVFPHGYSGRFLDREASLQALIEKPKSVIRMSDGESLIIMGGDIYFQDFSELLRNRLLQILNRYDDNSNYYLAIEHWALPLSTEKLLSLKKGKISYYKIMKYFRYVCYFTLKKNATYLDGTLFKGSSIEWLISIGNLISRFKYIVIVKSDPEIVTNLFDKIRIRSSFDIISIPAKNAFFQYDDILAKIENQVSKFKSENNYQGETLILTSAGPCAKVLAFDLSNRGYTVWDIGKMFECWLDKDIF